MLEKKKLNLGQPILSVRKYSSTKLNGRKIENGLPIILPTRLSPSVPVRIAGAVPFKWEKTPGKPKEQPKEQSDTPTKEANHHHHHHSGNMETEDQSKSSCHSEGCDDETTFVDALDTLSSRIESFILNSHMGGPSPTSKEKNLHSADSQTRASMRSTVRRRRQQHHRPRVLKMKIVRCKEKQQGSDTDPDWELLPRCGLRPGICLTTSVCIVNPVPAKNECNVKSKSKIQKSETKENKKSIWKKYEKPVIPSVPEATHHAAESNRKTFRELLAADHQGSPKELLGSGVHDKTLYLDTSNQQLNNTQRILEQLMQVADSSLEAIDQLMPSSSSSSAHINSCDDFNIVSSSSSLPKTCGKWGMVFARKTQDSTSTLGNDLGNKKYSEFLVSQPRLKSPSDSWLCRTLSSMYAENASRQHSYLAGSTKSSKPGLRQH